MASLAPSLSTFQPRRGQTKIAADFKKDSPVSKRR
jgi:hypothetical protein